MTDDVTQLDPWVIDVQRLVRGWTGAKMPADRPGAVRLVLVEHSGRRSVADQPAGSDPWTVFIRADPWALEVTIPAVVGDDQHDWDLVLAGRWTITDPKLFAGSLMDRLLPDMPLDGPAVSAALTGRVEQLIRDALRNRTVTALRDEQALPPKWWETRLAEWLDGCGVRAAVDRAEFVSATAAAAEQHRRQIDRETTAAAERHRLAEAELAEAARQADFDRRRADIRAALQLSDADRRSKLDQVDREAELARLDFEARRTEAELAVGKIVRLHAAEQAAGEAKLAEERVWRQREADAQFNNRRKREQADAEFQLEQLRIERDRLKRDGNARAEIVAAELAAAQKAAAARAGEAAMAQEAARLRVEQMQAEAGRASAAHQAAMARMAADESRRAEADAAERARRARHEQQQHEARLAAIRLDDALSAREKQLRAEAAALEIARLQREAAEFESRSRRAEESHRVQMELLEVQRRQLEKAADSAAAAGHRVDSQSAAAVEFLTDAPRLMEQLSSSDPMQAYQAAEQLTQKFGVPAAGLADVGFDAVTPVLLARMREQAAEAGHPVRLTKRDLRTRDIGARSVHALPIGARLNFELFSERPGYVTVVNLGTSGAFVLLAPGPDCPPALCRVEAGIPAPFPGPGLFPPNFELKELGPVGWEHLVVFVTDRPLITPDALGPDPVNPIDRRTVHDWANQLEASGGNWSVGLLSFEVVE